MENCYEPSKGIDSHADIDSFRAKISTDMKDHEREIKEIDKEPV
jgi:hypothetical protein